MVMHCYVVHTLYWPKHMDPKGPKCYIAVYSEAGVQTIKRTPLLVRIGKTRWGVLVI